MQKMHNGDNITSCGFKMTGGVIAFGNEDVVVLTALQWLVQGYGRTHESFLDSAESIETRLKFKVMIAGSFCNG